MSPRGAPVCALLLALALSVENLPVTPYPRDMDLPSELLVLGKLILLTQAAGRVSGRNTKTDFKAKG